LSYGELPSYCFGIKNALFLDSISQLLKSLFKKLGYDSESRSKEVGYIDGGFMMINREAYNSVNGFDEDYFFYSEEADFCNRLKKAGWKVVFQPKSQVTHFRGGVSESGGFSKSSIEMLISAKALYCRKNLSKSEGLFFLRSLKLRFKSGF
jgi:GT2 family glycosyltransferase